MWVIVFFAGLCGLTAGCVLLALGGSIGEVAWLSGVPLVVAGLALILFGWRIRGEGIARLVGPTSRLLSDASAAELADRLREALARGGNDLGVRISRQGQALGDSEFQFWVWPYYRGAWLRATGRFHPTPDGRTEVHLSLRPGRWYWYFSPAFALFACAIYWAVSWLYGRVTPLPTLIWAFPIVAAVTALNGYLQVSISRAVALTKLERVLSLRETGCGRGASQGTS